jgi:hypothetical protein
MCVDAQWMKKVYVTQSVVSGAILCLALTVWRRAATL